MARAETVSSCLIAALFAVVAGLTASGGLPDRVAATNGDIEITPLVHSSVQIEHAGKVIQVDPWSLGDLSRAKPADLILVTDDVGHHLDLKAIERLRKPGAPVVIAANGKSKHDNAREIKERLEALRGLPGLRRLDVGIDFAGTEQSSDVALYTEFDSREALDAYQVHPAHQEFAAFLTPLRSERRVVDYES